MPHEDTSGFEEMLHEKIGGVPVPVVGVGIAGVALVVLLLRRKSSATAAATPAPTVEVQSSGGLTSGETQALFDAAQTGPGNPFGLPTEGLPKPTSNVQWARLVADYLIAQGDDPTLVTQALADFLKRRPLTTAQKAIVERAVASPYGEPPEGLINIYTQQPKKKKPGPGSKPPIDCPPGFHYDEQNHRCEPNPPKDEDTTSADMTTDDLVTQDDSGDVA